MSGPDPSTAAPRRDGPALLLVGLNHQSAPLELRERVAFDRGGAEGALVHLLARPEVAEAFLLSTCNRTEVLLQTRADETAYRLALQSVFASRAPDVVEPGRLYVQRDAAAARHLLAVACGLDSMVLGEPEILGQVKQAAALAEEVGAIGPVLRRLLRSAAGAGRRARAETAIGAGAVSLGYAVVELARNIVRRLEDCAVLLLGAGEAATAVARDLAERGASRLTVVNRSRERAERFHAEFPAARMLPFEERLEAAAEADVVVASTSADEPVLSREQLDRAMRRRPARPLLVVDLGVPRNVDPEAGRLENVFLHPLDSLQHLIERNLRRRREEVPRVAEIVEQELQLFHVWWRGLEVEPVVAGLQRQAERIRADEVERARAHFPAESHAELERLTRAVVRKILHHPSARLRARRGEDDVARLDLVRELFHLDDDAEPGEGGGE